MSSKNKQRARILEGIAVLIWRKEPHATCTQVNDIEKIMDFFLHPPWRLYGKDTLTALTLMAPQHSPWPHISHADQIDLLTDRNHGLSEPMRNPG